VADGTPFGVDGFRDECGVVGVWGHPEAANLAYLGLYAMQHRGQEGAGIVSSDGKRLHAHRGLGLVADVFARRERLTPLVGDRAIGHVRYSTAGGNALANVQPLVVQLAGHQLAVGHNGNYVNALSIRRELEEEGAIFRGTADTEVLVHLIARSKQRSFLNRVVDALSRVEGAGSIVMMTEDMLVAARDPWGFRPLVLGRHRSGAWVLASESCALDLIEAELVRDIEPGEVVVVDDSGLSSFHPFRQREPRACIFEYVYFARPDTRLWGQDVYAVRQRLGEMLAEEQPAIADLVIPVPDSGVAAALGYARRAKIPFELGLVRNHYVGRSFIEPSQSIRDFGVKLKLNPVRELIRDQRVVVVDDSLVRGTTCKKIVRMLRKAGAAEVHLRIAAPPTTGPCHYGIDTPTRAELIAANNEVPEIGRYVGADSIGYLSVPGLRRAVDPANAGFCDACFSGRYPILHEDLEQRPQLPLFGE
jgi:amidophosphoribosyltransferase